MPLPGLKALFPDHLFYDSSTSHRTPPPTAILKQIRPEEPEPLYTPFQLHHPTTSEPQSNIPNGQTYAASPSFHLPPPTLEDSERLIGGSTSLNVLRNDIGIGFTNDRHSAPSPKTSTGDYQFRTFSLEPSPNGMVNKDEKEDADSKSGKGRESGTVDERYKKHTCSNCGKRFNRPSSLRIHLNTHTGAKPYVCPFPGCSRTFNVSSNMRRHYRNHEHRAPPPLPPPLQGQHQDRVDEDSLKNRNYDDGIAYAHWPVPVQPTQIVAPGAEGGAFESSSSSALSPKRSRAPHNDSGDNAAVDVRYIYPCPPATTDTNVPYSALNAVHYLPRSPLMGSTPVLYPDQPGLSYSGATCEHYQGSVYVADEANHSRELGLASNVSRFDLQRSARPPDLVTSAGPHKYVPTSQDRRIAQPNEPPTPPYTNEAASSPPVYAPTLAPLRPPLYHPPPVSQASPLPPLSHLLVPSYMRQHGLEQNQKGKREGLPRPGVVDVDGWPDHRPCYSVWEKDRSGSLDYSDAYSRGTSDRSVSIDHYGYAVRIGTGKDDRIVRDTDTDGTMSRDRDMMQQPSPDTPSLHVHALHGGPRRPESPQLSGPFVPETKNKSHECGDGEGTMFSPTDAGARASIVQVQIEEHEGEREDGGEGAERSSRAGPGHHTSDRRSTLDIKAIMNLSSSGDSSGEAARKVLCCTTPARFSGSSSSSTPSSPPPRPPRPISKAEVEKVDSEANSTSKSRTPGAAPTPPYPLYNAKRRHCLSPSPGPILEEDDAAAAAVENENTGQDRRKSSGGRRATKTRVRRRRG